MENSKLFQSFPSMVIMQIVVSPIFVLHKPSQLIDRLLLRDLQSSFVLT